MFAGPPKLRWIRNVCGSQPNLLAPRFSCCLRVRPNQTAMDPQCLRVPTSISGSVLFEERPRFPAVLVLFAGPN